MVFTAHKYFLGLCVLAAAGCGIQRPPAITAYGGAWEHAGVVMTDTTTQEAKCPEMRVEMRSEACLAPINEAVRKLPPSSKQILKQLKGIKTPQQSQRHMPTRRSAEPFAIVSLIMALLAVASLGLPGIYALSYFAFVVAAFLFAIISTVRNPDGLKWGLKFANLMITLSFIMLVLGLLVVFDPIKVLIVLGILFVVITMIAYTPWGTRK